MIAKYLLTLLALCCLNTHSWAGMVPTNSPQMQATPSILNTVYQFCIDSPYWCYINKFNSQLWQCRYNYAECMKRLTPFSIPLNWHSRDGFFPWGGLDYPGLGNPNQVGEGGIDGGDFIGPDGEVITEVATGLPPVVHPNFTRPENIEDLRFPTTVSNILTA